MKNKIILLLFFIFLLNLNFVFSWTDTAGGDHEGADYIPGNGTNISGVHTNIKNFVILPGYYIGIDGYQKTSYGGNVTIIATLINISGILDASGRGYGGGGGGSNIQSGYSCGGASGGVNGIGGTGANGAWSQCSWQDAFGGGGGGSPFGVGGKNSGTNGTLTSGGTGGNGCSGRGKSGGDGYGGGGGGGAGCTAGGAGGGGGGSGGNNAPTSTTFRSGGNGSGLYFGTGGNGTSGGIMNNGTSGGYRTFSSNGDSSVNTDVYHGSGGGGGGSTTNNGGGGGGGGGAGGGAIILNATTIDISGTVYSQGGGGGTGANNTDIAGYAGSGGGGSGGGVAILGCNINLTGTIDLRGRLLNSLSTTNAGTLKIFYNSLSDASIANVGRSYTNESWSAAGCNCNPVITIVYPLQSGVYGLNVYQLNYTNGVNLSLDSCWWSNSSGIWNSTAQPAGTNWTDLGVGDESKVDLMKNDKSVFMELKNKFNTVNSDSLSKVRDKLSNAVTTYPKATAYWAYIIEKDGSSGESDWNYLGNNNPCIKKIWGANVYEIVTGDKKALEETWRALPKAISNIIGKEHKIESEDMKKLVEFFQSAFLS